MDRTSDLESHYSPLAGASPNVSFPRSPRIVAVAVVSILLLAAGILLNPSAPAGEAGGIDHEVVRRGVDEGVSEKSNGVKGERRLRWSRDELSWQRTGFHFQPEKNWMNDPNGPLYYKGWYHLFYQYNPDSAVWGNITWGHAVSRDLVHWLYLPLAMVQDRWYDLNGVWTGSATILPDGKVVMLYTGSTNDSTQVQNLAFPDDHSDPLLLKWIKYESNPVLFPPEGIDKKDFRDPTTAWFVNSENAWRTAIGSKNANGTGITLVYQTRDFINYDLLPGLLHGVPETGMWECVDFFPVAAMGDNGLDTSENGPGVKHVLKASFDDDRNDYYAIGTYDPVLGTWVPDDPEADVGLRFRYDYGKFYAAKTFYDQERRRRVLWGWIPEADSEVTDVAKGWASLLGIPRAVRLDEKTGTNLIQWPVKEVDDLRLGHTNFSEIKVGPGSVVPLNVGHANQLDINVEFEVSKEAMAAVVKSSASYNCTSSKGAAENGVLGPFGLLVLSDKDRTEQTAVYFYVGKATGGKLTTFVCHDELRSSGANDIIKGIHGSPVPVLDGENLSLRVLVDHSIVETFAQGGRTCITSRVYPTKAIYGAARIFLFNNATNTPVTAKSVKVWEMNSAFLRPFDFTKD